MILSVIIPVFNVEKYIEKCIQSICSENLDMEIIIINDKSNDHSELICHKWAKKDKRIKIIHHHINRGLSAARNTGINIAQGDYITFIDSDDYISLHTLEYALKPTINNPDIDIIEYPVKIDHGSKKSYIYIPGNGSISDFNNWVIQKGYMRSYAWNKIYKRHLWNNIRFPENRLFEDMYTIPYIMKEAKNIIRINVGLYYYCKHKNSISNTLNINNCYEILNANIKFYNEINNSQNFKDETLDYIYLNLCNRQITYLEQGGNMIIPKRNISYKYLFNNKLNYKEKIKYLFMLILREDYCITLYKIKKLFKI